MRRRPGHLARSKSGQARTTISPSTIGSSRRLPLPGPVETLTARVFGAISKLRKAPALHPRGIVLGGIAHIDAPAGALADRSDVDVVVRLSRGIGWSEALPDFNGVAIRFLDAHGPGRHQDLLLTSAGSAPVLRHVLRPARTFRACGFSSVLPYSQPTGSSLVFRCDPLPIARLGDVAGHLPLQLSLRAASALGPWNLMATLQLREVMGADLVVRFDPWNTTGALVPKGLLNRLRGPAYEGSRAGTAAG